MSRGCATQMKFPEGRKGPFCELILDNPEGRGVIGKIPSKGGYGYFLELHNGSSALQNGSSI